MVRMMIVASPPIRPRILKVTAPRARERPAERCIASDPTEDTERCAVLGDRAGLPHVASPPIRPRILKASTPSSVSSRALVASPPIRPRILKVTVASSLANPARSCIASDPTEDTESGNGHRRRRRGRRVASPPIRPRILKVLVVVAVHLKKQRSCIASDPTEDTERQRHPHRPVSATELHRLRSDRGY